MTNIQSLKAIVKYPALAPKDFGYGTKVNVVLICNGEEIKIWGKPNSPIATLKKGEQVSLVFDGKSYKLATETQPSAALATEAIAPEKRGDYATRLGQATADYELAWNAAAALLKRKTGLCPEINPGATGIIRSIAADLFRAAG